MMRNRTALLAVLLVLAALAAEPAWAMRCGSRIISRGDHAAKLLKFCGEPTAVQSRVAQRSLLIGHHGRTVFLPGFVEEVLIEEWTYNLGPYKLMRMVRIENGIVADIRHLGYGYTP